MTARVRILAALLAVVPALTPVPASATTATPIGTWDGTVQVPGDTHTATFSFAADGLACLSFGTPSEVHGSGVGTWWQTGDDTFSYHILHDVLDPSGVLLAWVDVNQRAVQPSVSRSGEARSDLEILC